MVSRITDNVTHPFWIAHHNIMSKKLNGAEWYKQAWHRHTFNDLNIYEYILNIIPCQGTSSWMIQIGAHLGIFPQQGASRYD
jgi:hypothetical protein